jgi:hypothetical protein
MPSKWKRFGKVIINLDRVIRVEQPDEKHTYVYLAGLLPLPEGESKGPGRHFRILAPGHMQGAYLFKAEEAKEVWDYFDALSK